MKFLCARNFAKLPLLKAYVSVHKFDIICLLETYLNSSIYDESLNISGYFLICSDHSSNERRGGICIYYRNFLPLKVTGVRDFNAKLRQWHHKDSRTSGGISIKILHRSLDYIK